MRFPYLLPVAIAAISVGLLAACDNSKPPTAKAPAVAPAVVSWPPPAPPDQPVVADLLADNWEFVVDASGSMGSSACGTGGQPRMETAKKGVIAFASRCPRRQAAASGGFRATQARHRRVAQAREREPRRVRPSGVDRRPGGSTPLRSSIQLTTKVLTAQAQRQRGYGTYRLVVVTDGEADQGEDPAAFTKQLVSTTAITVHVIGFCVDGRRSLDLKGYTQYASAANPAALEKGLQAILAESSSIHDSKFAQ